MAECMKEKCPIVKVLKFLHADSVAGQGEGMEYIADAGELLESGFGIKISVDDDECCEMMEEIRKTIGTSEEELEIVKKLSEVIE